MAGLPHRGEAQLAYNYRFPTRTMFQNLEGTVFSDEGKTFQSPGRMKNSSYYIAPVGFELTTSRTP